MGVGGVEGGGGADMGWMEGVMEEGVAGGWLGNQFFLPTIFN